MGGKKLQPGVPHTSVGSGQLRQRSSRYGTLHYSLTRQRCSSLLDLIRNYFIKSHNNYLLVILVFDVNKCIYLFCNVCFKCMLHSKMAVTHKGTVIVYVKLEISMHTHRHTQIPCD